MDIPRFTLMLLLSVLLAMSALSCAPRIREWGKPDDQELIRNLPQDQALSFLRSLDVPEPANSCRFEEDGVVRWRNGAWLPGKMSYSSLYLSGLGHGEGPPDRFVLSVGGTNELWCLMHSQLLARHQDMDTARFLNKVYTALRVMGVRTISLSELSKIVQSPWWREANESVERREP
jgi:hypothetical protein